jgi:hypothetical protein
MAMTTTAALAALFIALAAFCGWRGAKPFDPLKGPRLMPWRPLMVVFATASLMLVVHLVNLGGFATGGGRR